MLRSVSHSLIFIVLRLVVVSLEIAVMIFGTLWVQSTFMQFMSGYVDGLFYTLLTPMGFIIGLGLSTIVINFSLKYVNLYLRFAHIIYMTMVTMEYKENILESFNQVNKNFKWLIVNAVATKGVVSALTALKDGILNVEFLKFLKEPKTVVMRFVSSVCSNTFKRMLNMTDELIVSYTWFTYDMYLTHLENKDKPKPKMSDQVKYQSKYMLEGMVLLVRVLPKLFMTTIMMESFFIIFVNVSVITFTIIVFYLSSFNIWVLIILIFFNRNLVELFYYALIEPLRVAFYIYFFYLEVSELEPLDINSEIGRLLGRIPLIGGLLEKADISVTPEGSEGEPLFETNFKETVVNNVTVVANAFNLNTEDLINQLGYNPEDETRNEEDLEGLVDSPPTREPVEQVRQERVEEEPPKVEEKPTRPQERMEDLEVEIEPNPEPAQQHSELRTESDPFNMYEFNSTTPRSAPRRKIDNRIRRD